MRKRIAIVLHAGIGGGFFSQGQPVIGKVVEQLANDFEVIVYSQLPPNTGVNFSGFKILTAPNVIKISWLRWLYLIGLVLLNHIKRRHHLIYSFWGYPAGFIVVCLAKLLNKPSVIHLQGGDATSIPSFQYGAFYGTYSRRLSSWAYKKASLLIALTLFQKNDLHEHGITRRVEVIPFGPDLRMFWFNENKFESNIVNFIHIGNHTPLKDQKTLLDAFSRIVKRKENCRLKFVGYDAIGGALKNYAFELGIGKHVEFIGASPYNRIPDFLFEADVMLHTSVYEGQATVISEAAACGVLLAGTRVGLLSDLGDDYGLIVNVGDADSLAEMVLSALVDRRRTSKYVQRARKWAEQYDQQWTVDTIKSHLNHLMKV